MRWEIEAVENLRARVFVEFIGDTQTGNICCKKTSVVESIGAITARDIAKGEILIYDTAQDTKDLIRLKDPDRIHETLRRRPSR